MKKFWVINSLILMIVFSCKSINNPNINIRHINTWDSIRLGLINKENVIILKISRQNDEYVVSQIDSSIYKLPEAFVTSLTSSINTCLSCYGISEKTTDTVFLNLTKENYESAFELIDINFDGNVDIRFPSEGTCCSGNNVIYETWINNERCFYHNKVLSEIAIWKIDKVSKQFESGWHMGAYDYYTATYKLVADSLFAIHEMKSDIINDSIQRTIESTLVNNSWKVDSTLVNINNP
jgi:hypothetical protein